MESAGKKNRILMLVENYSFPEDVRVFNEAVSLVRHGYEVTVISPKTREQTVYGEVEGIRMYRYPWPAEGNGLFGYIWEYSVSLVCMWVLSVWVFIRHGFDIVHAHSPPDLLVLIAMFFRPFGVRFVFDHHDISPEMYNARFEGDGNPTVVRVLKFFEKLSCRFACDVISVNESYRKLTIQRTGIPPERVTVVRNGPDLNKLRLVDMNQDLLERNQVILGYVGVMGIQDGIDGLLHALHKLKFELGRNDFYCVLIGKGDALEMLRRLATELDLDDNVLLTGYVTQKKLLEYLSSSDICISPDPFDEFNDRSTMIKMMEYMALAKPIVAYRLTEHQVTAKDAALYAEPNDQLDFARCILKLMDDPELRASMGLYGRQRVERRLAWPHQEKRLIDVYQNQISKLNCVTDEPNTQDATSSKFCQSDPFTLPD